ncbi:hypothetical protein ACEWY4_017858 [Coilia grayii]|uniref:Ig-like domain-containing protein n=1 Tax=Coilia grayii TaxID=363190 RepID=A0ABD1JJ69_9TELE
MCFLKGASVTLPCTYEYSWIGHYVRGEWYEQKGGRVREHSHSNYPDCSLQIDKLSDEHAGVYHFQFSTALQRSWITGGSGIRVSVTDLTVKETGVEKQNQIEVTCSACCSLGSDRKYIWYKNGQRLLDKTTASILVSEKSNYSCALPRYEAVRSPAVCVPSHRCMTHTECPEKKDDNCTVSLNITEGHSGEYGSRSTTAEGQTEEGTPAPDTTMYVTASASSVLSPDQSDSGLVYATVATRPVTSDPTQRAATRDQDDIQYANVQIKCPKTQTTQQDDSIIYSLVQFPRGSTATMWVILHTTVNLAIFWSD